MRQIKNSYYDIACNDIAYLEAIGDIGFYNQPSAICQQVVEKLLRSVIEQFYYKEDLTELLRTHSLKTLGRAIKECLRIMYDVKAEIDALRCHQSPDH